MFHRCIFLSVHGGGGLPQYLVPCPFQVSGPRSLLGGYPSNWFHVASQSLVPRPFQGVPSNWSPVPSQSMVAGSFQEVPQSQSQLGGWWKYPSQVGTGVPPGWDWGIPSSSWDWGIPLVGQAMDRIRCGWYASCVFMQDFLIFTCYNSRCINGRVVSDFPNYLQLM